MQNKHIALYCRTSTHLQSTGLEAQVRALRTYCQSNGIDEEVYGRYRTGNTGNFLESTAVPGTGPASSS